MIDWSENGWPRAMHPQKPGEREIPDESSPEMMRSIRHPSDLGVAEALN